MMCDYLSLKNTDETLYQAGADAWAECCIHDPAVASAYEAADWIYPLLDNVSKTEIKKIFIKMKQLLDTGLIGLSYPYFLYQVTKLVEAVAPNDANLSGSDFVKMKTCGEKVNGIAELEALAFSLN